MPIERNIGYGTLFNVKVYSWIILATATFAQLTISYVTQGIGTLAPFLADSFNLNNTLIGLSGVVVNAGMMLTSALAGALVDRVGEKVVLVAGGVLTGVGIMLTSQASTFYMFLALLFFTGIWAAAATPAGSKAVMTWFPYSKRGLALGIRQTGIPLGGLAAALSLPVVAIYFTWRAAMLEMGIVALLGAVVAFFILKEDHSGAKQRQKTGKDTVRQVLQNRSVWLLSIMAIAYGSAQFTLVAHLLTYLHKALGHTIILASMLLALAQLTGAIARVVLGVLSDTLAHGRRKPLLIGCGLLMVMMAAAMSLVSPATPAVIVAALVLLFGLAAIGWNGLFVTFVSEIVGMDQAGTAVGLGLTLTQIGVLGFPPLFGFVVDTTGSYGPGWLLLSTVTFVGLVVLYQVKEKSPGNG